MSQDRKITVVKKAECAKLPPDIADAVRELVRQEHQRLRRDEMFYMLRGMKSQAAELEKELNVK